MSTTVTGTLVGIGTGVVKSGTFVRFQLRGATGIQPFVTGVGSLAQGSGAGREWFEDFSPDPTTGLISGSVYSTRDSTGLLAGEITVNGNGTACWYEVSIYRNGKKVTSVHTHAKNGTTLDIGNMTPLTSTPTQSSLSADQIYARLDGSNAPFTGAVVGKNGTVGSPSFSFATSLTTGFWRQAADVIGVSIAGVLKWIVNAAGVLVGSGQAIGFSSNADPSAAGGDIFLNRQAANKAGLGTTAGTKDGILLLSKVAAGGTEATGSVAGDITAARSSTSGAAYLGTDGNGVLFRNGDAVTLGGTTKVWTFPATTDTLSGKATADVFTNKTLTGAASGNSVSLLNEQGPIAEINGTGAAVTAYTYTLPANTMQAGKGIRIKYWANHSTGAGAMTHQISFGGTLYFNVADSGATGQIFIEVNIFNNSGVTNAQHGATQSFYPGVTVTGTAFAGLTSAINTTGAVAVTVTFNSAAGTKLTPEIFIVELIQ